MRWIMPTSAQLAVSSTPVKVAQSNGSPIEVHLHVAGNAVYLDGAGVTTSTGFKLDNNDSLTITLADNEALWAVTATSSTLYTLVSVL
jgi:hypothetical protein